MSLVIALYVTVRVAPLAGAWIEIHLKKAYKEAGNVAPLAGAWIEIYIINPAILHSLSLPSRERGLKSRSKPSVDAVFKVAPLAGAWIEIPVGNHAVQEAYCRSPRGSVD